MLALPYYYLAGAYLFASEFDLALEAASRADEVGEIVGDRRARANAGVTRAFALTWRGQGEEAIAAAKRALEYSPDAFETAMVLGAVGAAYLEKGDVDQARQILEKAVTEATRFRSRQIQSSWHGFLAEAYLQSGRLDEARTSALQALELGSDARYLLGIGGAEWTLGRISRVSGNLSEAQAYLTKAMQILTSINARYWVARTHVDLAVLAGDVGDPVSAATHLRSARSLFEALRIPNWVMRTDELASQLELDGPR